MFLQLNLERYFFVILQAAPKVKKALQEVLTVMDYDVCVQLVEHVPPADGTASPRDQLDEVPSNTAQANPSTQAQAKSEENDFSFVDVKFDFSFLGEDEQPKAPTSSPKPFTSAIPFVQSPVPYIRITCERYINAMLLCI